MRVRQSPVERRGPRGSVAPRWLFTLALLGVLMILTMLYRTRSNSPPPDRSSNAELSPWDLLGCYQLEVEPWKLEASVLEGGDDPSAAPHPGLAASFPSAIMLRPDSVDEWGRPLETYGVLALPPKADSIGTRPVAADELEQVSTLEPLRWFTRADTLWILGSLPGTRAGIALFDRGDSLSGRARLLARAGSLTTTSRAVARPINCATRELESAAARPRR